MVNVDSDESSVGTASKVTLVLSDWGGAKAASAPKIIEKAKLT